MNAQNRLSDAELIDALALSATALNMARAEDLRRVAHKVSQHAAAAAARLREILALGEPWPTADVLARLADGADHLLRDHGCDKHGYEGLGIARDRGRVIAATIRTGGGGAPMTEQGVGDGA